MALHLALDAVWRRIGGEPRRVLVGGSCGLMLRGIPTAAPPRDLDLYCDAEDVEQLAGALADVCVEPPALSTTERYSSVLSRYRVLDVQVELVGGFRVFSRGCEYRVEARRWIERFGERIDVNGWSVPIVPLAHELLFNVLRDRPDRSIPIAQVLRRSARQLGELNELLGDNRWTAAVRDEIRSLLLPPYGEEG